MFCPKISNNQIFFFRLAAFYFCDIFAKRIKRERKESKKSEKYLVVSRFICIFAMYKRGGFGHRITLVIHHLKH